jgi:nucleoside recognition membrane protein YjiH
VTGGVAGGVLIALNDAPDHLTASSAQTLNFLQSDIPSMLASMAFGVMAIAAGVAIVKSTLLPTWLGWVSLVLGILGIVPIGDFFGSPD